MGNHISLLPVCDISHGDGGVILINSIYIRLKKKKIKGITWEIQSIVGIYFLRFMERSLELSISFLHLNIGYSIFLEMLIELQGSWYYSISFVTFFSLQIG